MLDPRLGSGGPLSPEAARQLDERFQELSRQAGNLRSLLSGDPDLERLARELLAAMQGLDSKTGNLTELSSTLIDRWKELELRLSRRLDGDKADPVRLAGQERVPERYRPILEEYYRSLSRSAK